MLAQNRVSFPFGKLFALTIALIVSCSDPSGVQPSREKSLKPPEPVLAADQIVFGTDRDDGNAEIYRVTLDSGFVNLTNHPGRDYSPSLSPDRKWIVFMSWRNGGMDLFLMRVDGSDTRQLTNDPGSEFEPAWSPDGTKVIFTASNDLQCMDLSTVDVLTGVITPLWAESCDDPNRSQDTGPVFAPDGSRVFYNHGIRIYTALPDGSGRTLVRPYAMDAAPSPDGNLILFTDVSVTTDLNLALMTPDGTLIGLLTSETSLESDGAWSADGEWIAFRSNRTGDAELYVMRKDGTGVRQITNTQGGDGDPTW